MMDSLFSDTNPMLILRLPLLSFVHFRYVGSAVTLFQRAKTGLLVLAASIWIPVMLSLGQTGISYCHKRSHFYLLVS